MLAKSTLIFHYLLFQVFKYMNKKPNPHWKFDKNLNGMVISHVRYVKVKEKNPQQIVRLSKVLTIISEAS